MSKLRQILLLHAQEKGNNEINTNDVNFNCADLVVAIGIEPSLTGKPHK